MEKIISKTPKISIVMPVYNGGKYLEESIKSILNQTFKDFEFIIINDGSTDNSKKIIEKFGKIDKRIIIIYNKKNIGSADSINSGIKKSRGKYIACFCADDISHEKRLETEFNFLEKNPKIFLVGTSGIYIDETGREIRRFRKYNNYKLLAWRLKKSCGIIFPSIMFRNKEVIYLDKKFVPADDYNLYFELLKKGKNLTNLSPFLVKIRVHDESLSNSDKKKQENARDKIIEKFNGMKNKTNIINKIYYSIFLLIHYIKTRNEKRIK